MIKKNRILIFNRITTHDTLKDVSVYERFLGEFYYEFSHLYNIIATEDVLSYVDDIWCKLDSDKVEFYLEINNKASMKKLMKKLNKAVDNESRYMDCVCWEDNSERIGLASVAQ